MTMNNPLGTLQAFSPTAQGVISQFQAGQNSQTARLNQDLLGSQIKQQDMVNQGLEQNQNITNTVNRLQQMEQLIGMGANEQQLAQTLQGFIAESKANGGNPIDSEQALQALQQGGVDGLNSLLGQAKTVFQNQGFIAAPEPIKSETPFAKIDPSKYNPESVAAFEASGRYSDLQPVTPENVDPEYIKELRSELRTSTADLQKQAASLKTNFGKLNNLADEMRNGNRSAVAQGLVALVKLGDPGSVVKEEELKQALGSKSPTAAVADVLRGKGVDSDIANSIIQSLDPLNPDAVNVDQILGTAEAMLKPNIDAIVGAYDTGKSRASEQLTSGGLNSIFGSSRDELFNDIRGLSFGVEPTQAKPQVQELVTPSGVVYTVE